MSNRRKIKAPTGPRTTPPAETYWNGQPIAALRGTAVVADTDEFPGYWARRDGLIGDRIPVVRVEHDGGAYAGGTEYLDDRDGSGWRKVTEGHGGPRWPHRNVIIESGTFELGAA